MKNILTILKKELKRFFTDKRMVLTLLLPGLLIYVMYSLIGSGMMSALSPDNNHEYTVYVENQPEEFKIYDENKEIKITIKELGDLTKDEVKTMIKEEEADLFIVYEEDFINKINDYTTSPTIAAPQVEMYYNSVSTESQMIFEYYRSMLDAYEASITNKFDINNNPDVQFDLATKEDISASLITSIFPFLIIIFLFSGCVSIAPESIAGEKERGTIATLLVTPIKRRDLAIGKIISLSVISLLSALASFLGIVLSLPRLFQGVDTGISIAMYGFKEYLGILFIIIMTVLLFVVLISIISTFAKSVKEANNYAMPLMLIIVVLGMLSMFGGGKNEPSIGLFFIPIYNSTLCLTELFGLKLNMTHILITTLSNFAYVGLGVLLLAKMFNNEKVMFNK